MRFVLVLALGTATFGQSSPDGAISPQAIPLKPLEEKVLESQEAQPFAGQIKCDADGNVYFMGYKDGDFDLSNLQKLNRRLELSKITMTKLPGLSWRGSTAFSVSRDGSTSMIVSQREDFKKRPVLFISNFDKDGSYRSHQRIEESVVPLQLGTFPTGEFLLAARKEERTKDGVRSRPFVGLYDREAKFVKELTLEGDKQVAKDLDNADLQNPVGNLAVMAVDLSQIVMGLDGNAYLLRHTIPAMLYAIDSTGTVLRTMRIEPPLPGMSVFGFQASEGKIAIRFRPPTGLSPILITTVSPTTGEQINLFNADEVPGGAFSCYTEPERFTFLHMKKSKLSILVASP